jgi:HTH-type transcriptional regulator/antitoxin HigA
MTRKTVETEMMKLDVKPEKKYLDLIKRFPLNEIRSEEENELAAEICDQLLDNFDSLSAQERDYFEVLSRLVEKFEAQWQEDKMVAPPELLKYLMEQNNISQTDLIPEFGTSSRASEFLSGKRPLSLPQIVKLANRFNLSTSAFIATV